MLKINTDAAVNNKTRKAGIGLVVVGEDMYEQISVPLSNIWDNHSAEFKAIDYALDWLIEKNLVDELILLKTDSKIASDSINNGYVKNDQFKPLLDDIITKMGKFSILEIIWIPEKHNKGADNLAKQALLK